MFFTFPAETESSQMHLGNFVWAEPGSEHTTGARPGCMVPPGTWPLLLHQARARYHLDEGTRCHELTCQQAAVGTPSSWPTHAFGSCLELRSEKARWVVQASSLMALRTAQVLEAGGLRCLVFIISISSGVIW